MAFALFAWLLAVASTIKVFSPQGEPKSLLVKTWFSVPVPDGKETMNGVIDWKTLSVCVCAHVHTCVLMSVCVYT